MRITLVVVIAVLLVTIGYLASLLIARRRRPPEPPQRAPKRVQVTAPPAIVTPFVRRVSTGGRLSVGGGGTGVWEATRGQKQPAPAGVIAKICPACGNRYDLATTVCGKDGSELVTIN